MIKSNDLDSHRPVIVLGAARSGTKMIRAAIASHPNLVAVPYDVNFIWKYGNYGIDHDELAPEDLTPRKKAFIRAFLDRFRDREGVRVVEKTVSNSIRVQFVRAVFPNCQFIHLIRDGRDVSASSLLQWRAPMGTRSVLRKSKHFPVKAMSSYGLRYGMSYVHRLFSREKRVSSWGVHLKDLDQLLRQYSLIEVCGLQWRRCVEHTIDALAAVSSTDHLEVRYEDLVSRPLHETQRIMDFLNLKMTSEVVQHVEENIQSSSVAKWQNQLSAEDAERLTSHICGTLKQLGYPADRAGLAAQKTTTPLREAFA